MVVGHDGGDVLCFMFTISFAGGWLYILEIVVVVVQLLVVLGECE